MCSSDTTTTLENQDLDEDRTLILDGKQRLKYFSGDQHPVHKPLTQKKRGYFKRFRDLLPR